MRVAGLVLTAALVAPGALGACGRGARALGHPCSEDSDCDSPLVCTQWRCALAESSARGMIDQAGAGGDTAERPVVGGQPVKVRWASATNYAFAACRPDERLLSGGCSGGLDGEDSRHLRSWPGDFSETDTLGARWYCMGSGEVNAFALCQQPAPPLVVPSPPAPADAAVAPSR